MLREAQYIERLAGGESTSLIESRQRSAEEIEEIQTRVSKVGGPVTDEEAIAQLGTLSTLPVAEMLRAWGLTPQKPGAR